MKKNYHRLTSEHREILMSNPLYKNLIVEFRDGWFDIINNLGNDIRELCEETNEPLPEILQVKEKMGTLRFYYKDISTKNIVNRCIRSLVTIAEMQSERTCEHCGNRGELSVTDGVWATLCDTHKPNGALTTQEYISTNQK